ncbi:MAG: LruC domain-containing protein [Bacteroidales bacterium]|nr:LruC domain-containing protein [Bacteroidales bacterium]
MFILVISTLGLISCQKELPDDKTNISAKFGDLNVSPQFAFKTASEKLFSIEAYDNINQPVPGVRFDIYTAHPDSGGVLMTSGASDSEGKFSGMIALPDYLKNIVVSTRFIGFPSETKVSLNGNQFHVTYGGAQKTMNLKSTRNGYKSTLQFKAGVPLNFLGTFNSLGVPDYLEPSNDPIGQDLLNDINASLPEKRPVPQYNPEYLESGNETSLTVVQESDIWLTYVHEGAGYRNTIGFYTYDVNDPPATVSDITSITIIYPNVSYQGSGGGLISGNKVLLGRFPANTRIGWVMLQNAFNGTVNPNALAFYSDSWLNPESNANRKQHALMLLDPGRDLVLLSFEDQRRDGSCDNDFNDAIFYVTANPVEGIQYTSMPLITYVNPDSDSDGVPDIFDDFPEDSEKAFISYFPGETTYGSLAFEDMWPDTGDYDFNDLVIKYRFSQITNGNNDIVQIRSSFIPTAMGANLKSGFGFQLPGVSPSNVESATGMHLTENIVDLSENGTETGQSEAVFIVFDKALTTFSDIGGENPDGMQGLNTVPGGRTGTPGNIEMVIDFITPFSSSAIGVAPYNPFIFVMSQRSHEIHLPDMQPTDQMNQSLFGTKRDDSRPGNGRYFRTENNLPWAMNVVDDFEYTVERAQINSAFLLFGDWAESSGVQNKDWFKNVNGYRDNTRIYNAN